jgi:acyl dehydratase
MSNDASLAVDVARPRLSRGARQLSYCRSRNIKKHFDRRALAVIGCRRLGRVNDAERAVSLATLDRFVGEELGVSSWVDMVQSRINEFAHCTGDDQWIHVDVERAKRESPFGGAIAHGYLSLSIVGPTSLEVWIRPAEIAAALNYGIDRVRFIAPVPAGKRVRNRIKLVAVEPKGGGRTLITTENTVEIEDQDKPALIANVLTMAVA